MATPLRKLISFVGCSSRALSGVFSGSREKPDQCLGSPIKLGYTASWGTDRDSGLSCGPLSSGDFKTKVISANLVSF